jgi:hypothetical protein
MSHSPPLIAFLCSKSSTFCRNNQPCFMPVVLRRATSFKSWHSHSPTRPMSDPSHHDEAICQHRVWDLRSSRRRSIGIDLDDAYVDVNLFTRYRFAGEHDASGGLHRQSRSNMLDSIATYAQNPRLTALQYASFCMCELRLLRYDSS